MASMICKRSIAWPPVGIAILLGATGAAWANPVPDLMFYSHVRPVEGYICVQLPIGSCDELVQSTTLTGPLEFDVFVEWQPDWTFLSVDVCGAPGGSFTREGHTGILHMPSFDSLPFSSGLLGLARIILDVTSPGWFRIVRIENCNFSEWTSVRAGLECGECAWPCSWGPYGLYGASFPSLDPDELELRTETGKTAVGQIDVGLYDIQPGEHISYVTAESWLSLETHSIPPGYYDRSYEITVTADADSLDPGVYEGWVEVQRMRCSECARIVLTVVPPTGV